MVCHSQRVGTITSEKLRLCRMQVFGSVDLLLKSTRRHKKRFCFAGGGDEITVSFRTWLLSESRVDYASQVTDHTYFRFSCGTRSGLFFWPWVHHSGSPEQVCGVHRAPEFWDWLKAIARKIVSCFYLSWVELLGLFLHYCEARPVKQGCVPPEKGALCEWNPLCCRHKLQGDLVTILVNLSSRAWQSQPFVGFCLPVSTPVSTGQFCSNMSPGT